jgi:IS30 family transposase
MHFRFELAKDKAAETVNKVTVELFSSIESEKVVTMTSDNGKEFTWLVAIMSMANSGRLPVM